jgi:hypothetical protein
VNELSPEVIRRNRWLFAERLHWPEGAVETCEQLESEHPGFEVWWFPKQRSEVPVFDREAGFYAWRFGAQPGQMWGDTWHGRDEWFGATPEKLDAELSAFA